MFLALFAETDELTAIFMLVGIVAWVLAAFAGTTIGKRAGGAIGLVGIGLAFFWFPTMWRTFDVAFE